MNLNTKEEMISFIYDNYDNYFIPFKNWCEKILKPQLKIKRIDFGSTNRLLVVFNNGMIAEKHLIPLLRKISENDLEQLLYQMI